MNVTSLDINSALLGLVRQAVQDAIMAFRPIDLLGTTLRVPEPRPAMIAGQDELRTKLESFRAVRLGEQAVVLPGNGGRPWPFRWPLATYEFLTTTPASRGQGLLGVLLDTQA